jgi:hypothetical protein
MVAYLLALEPTENLSLGVGGRAASLDWRGRAEGVLKSGVFLPDNELAGVERPSV